MKGNARVIVFNHRRTGTFELGGGGDFLARKKLRNALMLEHWNWGINALKLQEKQSHSYVSRWTVWSCCRSRTLFIPSAFAWNVSVLPEKSQHFRKLGGCCPPPPGPYAYAFNNPQKEMVEPIRFADFQWNTLRTEEPLCLGRSQNNSFFNNWINYSSEKLSLHVTCHVLFLLFCLRIRGLKHTTNVILSCKLTASCIYSLKYFLTLLTLIEFPVLSSP